MEIIYSGQFAKRYKKLSVEIKMIAEKKEDIFRVDVFDPRLKTHKLHGRLDEYWAFSINNDYRIIFEFGEGGLVYFHTIGTHDIYE